MLIRPVLKLIKASSSLPMTNWYTTWYKASGMTGSSGQYEEDLRTANFRYSASIEQLDYSADRGLDKNLVQRLSTCDFIKKGEDSFYYGQYWNGKKFFGICPWPASLFIGA